MNGFGWFLLICLAGGALFPVRWGFRIWLLLAMPLVTALLLSPRPQWDDVDLFQGLGEFITGIGLATILAGVGLRWAVAQWRAGDRDAAMWRRLDELALRGFDGVIAAVAGLCAGLGLTLAVALILRGVPGGLGLHLVVAGLALGLAGWLVVRARGPEWEPERVAGVAAVLVLAVFAGLGDWPGPAGSRPMRRGSSRSRRGAFGRGIAWPCPGRPCC